MQRKDIPRHFICPLSLHIYLEPITVTPSGQTYEKEMLDIHIQQAKEKNQAALCPLTKMPIESSAIAWGIKSAVDVYLKENPDMKEEQYKKSTVELTATHDKNDDTLQQIAEDEALARELAGDQTQSQPRPQPEVRSQAPQASQSSSTDDIFFTFFSPPPPGTPRREMLTQSREERTESPARTETRRERLVRVAREQEESVRSRNSDAATVQLNIADTADRDKLLADIQNLIFALEFERGPKPRGSIQNDSLLLFAILEQAFFLEPLPWQKIKVAEGPRLDEMHKILKAAKEALNAMDPEILATAKQNYAGKYDLVKPLFGGAVSLNQNGYAKFARAMGTVNNQPGYLTDQILIRVERMLADMSHKYSSRPESGHMRPH